MGLILILAWMAPGWFAATVGTPLWMKRADPAGYQLIRAFSGSVGGWALFLCWAFNLDGMRDADWRDR